MTNKLVFFGGGNMAEAIFSKLRNNPSFNIEIIQNNHERAQELSHKYPEFRIQQTLDNTLDKDDILIIAVKPQHAKEAIAPIKEKIKNCIIISVMAGIPSKTIINWTDNQRVVRTMPNTPASLGLGATAIYCPELVTAQERTLIYSIFEAIGIIYPAQDESFVDKVLPVTSSTVAFIYYFIEGFINHAVERYGFTETDARNLVNQTVMGSSAMINKNPDIAIEELRARVTSKKGTTEQGILTFEANGLHDIIAKAMDNCYNRALEMAKEFN